ncbi:MAG TPA: hypothetical protein VEV15_10955, partial [Flavisolibacter sp.]|nr:hypothetical protein [Flavisolibacter sp.]
TRVTAIIMSLTCHPDEGRICELHEEKTTQELNGGVRFLSDGAFPAGNRQGEVKLYRSKGNGVWMEHR